MTMITPSYLGETIEYSSLHACRSTLEDPTLATAASSSRLGNVPAAASPSGGRPSGRADTVLVVDDSAVDRKLAGRLLEKHGFVVRTANDGQAALDEIERERPDIVVTDLHMPGRSGLDLARAVRERHPSLPVVLMTAHGSEDIAVLALRSGAASYVPKRRLAQDLVETIDAIVRLSRGAQDRAGYPPPVSAPPSGETVFVLDNDTSRIPELVGALETELAKHAICDETESIQVGVALREAIVNAIFHGNLEVSSSLLEEGGEAFTVLADARRLEEPYASRAVRLSVKYAPDEVTYTIADGGSGFDPSSLPDPMDPANLERVHGRGVMLMRMFMDDVVHSARGTVVTMTKRRR